MAEEIKRNLSLHRELYSVPLGAIFSRSAAEADHLFGATEFLPNKAREILASAQTGAYMRGLVKQYGLPDDEVVFMAYTVLRLCLGIIKKEQLPGELAGGLEIDQGRASNLAGEIAKDLLAPAVAELEEFWAKGGSEAPPNTTPPEEAGVGKVVDLRNQPRREIPRPPAIPQ